MAIPDTVAALDDDDQLSLWVGRVARINALLEYDLGNVWRVLGGEAHPVGIGLDQLAGDCRRLLRDAHAASSDLVVAGASALTAAQKANSGRNRIVHDLWLADASSADPGAGTWNSFRLTSGQIAPATASVAVTLELAVETYESLRRVRTRVSGLFMALDELSRRETSNRGGRPEVTNMTRYLAMMNGHFELRDNGDVHLIESGMTDTAR